MRQNIFIATVIVFALLMGGMAYVVLQNKELKAENDELKANSANKDGLQRTDSINSYY